MSESMHPDSHDLAQFGYKQELHRTLGSFSSFAAGFSYISILTGMFQTSALGFYYAGNAFLWAWPVVFFGQMMVALQFSEMSAHFPLAGSVYQWSKQIANKAWAWNTGWIYLMGQIVTVPAVAIAWAVILPQISLRFQLFGTGLHTGVYDPDFGKTAIGLGIIMIVLTTIINIAGVSVMSKVNNVGVLAELFGASLLIILLAANITRGLHVTTDTFTSFNPYTGHPGPAGQGHAWGYLGALLIGGLMPLYVMYGFDSAGSLAEETSEPRRTAPRAILRALATAGVLGFLLILFAEMAVSDPRSPGLAAGGLAYITKDVLGSTWGDLFLWDVALAIFVCCLAIQAMSVRILFSMARDNNLPFARQLAHVSGARKVPVVPAVFVGVFAIVVLAVNWTNTAVFQIVVAMGIILFYMAYLGVTLPLLQQRMGGWPKNLPDAKEKLFSLGGFAVVTNVIAVVWGVSMVVNLLWPRPLFYGPKWYQEYGPLILIPTIVVIGLVYYYGWQRHKSGVLAEHMAEPLPPQPRFEAFP
jgi:urea carboxylase system permease